MTPLWFALLLPLKQGLHCASGGSWCGEPPTLVSTGDGIAATLPMLLKVTIEATTTELSLGILPFLDLGPGRPSTWCGAGFRSGVLRNCAGLKN